MIKQSFVECNICNRIFIDRQNVFSNYYLFVDNNFEFENLSLDKNGFYYCKYCEGKYQNPDRDLIGVKDQGFLLYSFSRKNKLSENCHNLMLLLAISNNIWANRYINNE